MEFRQYQDKRNVHLTFSSVQSLDEARRLVESNAKSSESRGDLKTPQG